MDGDQNITRMDSTGDGDLRMDDILNILSIIFAPIFAPYLGFYYISLKVTQDYMAWPQVGNLVHYASMLGFLITLSIWGIKHKHNSVKYLSLILWLALVYFMINGFNDTYARFRYEQNLSFNPFLYSFIIYIGVNVASSLVILSAPYIYKLLFRRQIYIRRVTP